VKEKALELQAELKAQGFRVHTDISDKSPGWKFAEYEMKGVPVRLEIGPRDIEKAQVVLVRRDNGEKEIVAMADLAEKLPLLMTDIHDSLLAKARARMEEKTYEAHNMAELKEIGETKPGFIKAMWCGDLACEEQIKEEAGLSSRCIPFEGEAVADTCVCCDKPADKLVIWGKAY
jgi:prolyl-tRNA synthetase